MPCDQISNPAFENWFKNEFHFSPSMLTNWDHDEYDHPFVNGAWQTWCRLIDVAKLIIGHWQDIPWTEVEDDAAHSYIDLMRQLKNGREIHPALDKKEDGDDTFL